ncbi:MAG: hypothetical protein SFX73_09320 [Kofleriaceae bacterium]|nr:hypothetical protein [Kofleriaceae bacterium]
MPTQRFASRVDRSTKAQRGRTPVETTPIAIRSGVPLKAGFEDRIRARLAMRLGHAASLIERGTVRFEDINGPRGGVDTKCRIKVVISGRPSVQVEETASTPEQAFARAMPRLANAISRTRSKHGLTSGRERARRSVHRRPTEARAVPEKPKRGSHRATVILETSAGRPSRKSTRKSANRKKHSTRKERAVTARKMRPGAKAARAKSQRNRARGLRR